jgi:hypothetical protein
MAELWSIDVILSSEFWMSGVLPITKLTSTTLDEFLGRQASDGRQTVIDLTPVEFVTPGALVPLAAICHSIAKRSRITIRLSDGYLRTYLMRSGFTSVLAGIADFDPSIPIARTRIFEALRGTNPVLLEVTKIENGAALPALLKQIVHVLRYRLKYQKYDAYDIAIAISEICQNTFDHNSDTCGFIAMQMYGGKGKRFLEIAVADHGVGLRETLLQNSKNPTMNSDFDAIELATQLGASQFDDPTRGTGLHHLLQIAYKHEAAVEFRTGVAKVRFRMDKRRGWRFGCSATPGVLVNLSLPSKKKV